jgi:ADP-ribose pyrophosphatase YjhB (NUDIX family)
MHPTTDRLSILGKIRRTVGDNSEQGRVKDTLIFCVEDGELMRDAQFWQRHYTHQDHTRDRAFIFFPTTKWAFNDQGELRHFTGGTAVYRQDTDERRYCLFRRRTHPIGYYTIPAGHFEMGEDPQEAALREAYEETQLGVVSTQLLYEEEVLDECRRGADYHVWSVYLCQGIGEPRMSEEADIIGWYTRKEIINELPLTRPTGYFLAQLFGETPRHVRQR